MLNNEDRNSDEDTGWNLRDERRPVFRWIVLAIILAFMAYMASGR